MPSKAMQTSLAALAVILAPVQSELYRGTVKVTNNAPMAGTCQTPVWVGIHDGTFDTYDREVASTAELEALAEDGNNAPIIASFAASAGGEWDGVVGGAPICPGESAEVGFEIDVAEGTPLFFSYASMVLPSNDAFVANGNPMAHMVFDTMAAFTPATINVLGSAVLDAGTEENTEIPLETAFFGQVDANTGVVEGGVINFHPGFNPAAMGGILADARFSSGDFTAEGYEMMQIEVTAAKVVEVSGYITVKNTAPEMGTCQTPVWVGVHDGTFDTYDREAATSAALEPLAEDGNNAPLIADFATAPGGVWDGVVGSAPICPGDVAMLPFTANVTMGSSFFFSYASMVLPSNDAFVANGNPMAHMVVDTAGMLTPLEFDVQGSEVLDAGTEVNTESPADTAFFGQSVPNTGTEENGVIVLHPGFNAVGTGGILDDAMFANGDFTAEGYEMMKISVTMRPVVEVSGYVTVKNTAPDMGTCQTPVWVGIHDGTFDTYDREAATSAALEPLAEDGNNAPLIADFAAAPGGVWDGVVGNSPICPGDVVTIPFTAHVETGSSLFFSYASMVLPSNDAFVANGNPMAHMVVDTAGMLTPLDFNVMGSEVLDAGTEVNTEIPMDTAFFGQSVPNTGPEENGVIVLHPGFNAVGTGGILDDAMFANGDFTAEGYQALRIEVTMNAPATPSPVAATAAPSQSPVAAPSPEPIDGGLFEGIFLLDGISTFFRRIFFAIFGRK